MKYLVLIAFLLVGCNNNPTSKDTDTTYVGFGVSKFKDGDVTCYLYYQDGISCLRNVK